MQSAFVTFLTELDNQGEPYWRGPGWGGGCFALSTRTKEEMGKKWGESSERSEEARRLRGHK